MEQLFWILYLCTSLEYIHILTFYTCLSVLICINGNVLRTGLFGSPFCNVTFKARFQWAYFLPTCRCLKYHGGQIYQKYWVKENISLLLDLILANNRTCYCYCIDLPLSLSLHLSLFSSLKHLESLKKGITCIVSEYKWKKSGFVML